MSALRRGTVALAAAVIVPMTARAADGPAIRILPPACQASPVSMDEFVDSMLVELAGRQPRCCAVGADGDASADVLRVTLSIEPCDPATPQIGVVIEKVAEHRFVERQVALADLPPEARPRALALAVAEMIRTAGEPEEPVVVLPTPIPPPNDLGSARPLAIGGLVAGDMQHHFGHGTTLWGARLGISLTWGRWQAAVDAGAATNQTEFSVGSVSTLLANAALFAGPRFTAGPVVIGVGPTGALGWARIKGQSNTTDVVAGEGSALVATAGLRAAVAGPAGHVIGACGWLEAGLTVRRFDADVLGAPAAGIAGPYVLIAAGVRFGPG